MTERQMLEMAARAAGIKVGTSKSSDANFMNGLEGLWFYEDSMAHSMCRRRSGKGIVEWNPLTDDGDALRLAVKLRLDICRPHSKSKFVGVWLDHLGDFIEEKEGSDPYAATRLAITRAAAEIGKTFKE